MNATVARLTARSLLGRRRAYLLMALPGVLIVLCVLVRLLAGEDNDITVGILGGFALSTLVPLLGLIAGTGSIGPEIDDGSIVYLIAKPVPRRSVVLSKYGEDRSYEEISADTGVAVSALKMRVARGSAQLRRTLVGAGITLATVALIFVSHTRDNRKPRTATVVACDTLRAIMHDTLGASTRDSILPPGRCGEDTRAPAQEQRLRDVHDPHPGTDF